MHTISMGLANIADKPYKDQVSNSVGLLIVSPQSFADFMADSENTKHIHIAIASGLEAAKRTSEIFALCYQIILQSIDIEIQTTDSIYTDTLQYYTTFIPSFKPKHFCIKKYEEIKPTIKIQDETQSNIRMRFNRAITNFQDKQIHTDKQQTKITKTQGYYGFEARVCVKANAQVAPDIESMYALQTALLSLFRIFKHDELATIAKMHLI